MVEARNIFRVSPPSLGAAISAKISRPRLPMAFYVGGLFVIIGFSAWSGLVLARANPFG